MHENAARSAPTLGNAIAATDTDGDALTYALSGSGRLRHRRKRRTDHRGRRAGPRDPGASYSLTVTVNDGKDTLGEADTSEDDSITVIVNVGNVDEAGVRCPWTRRLRRRAARCRPA